MDSSGHHGEGRDHPRRRVKECEQADAADEDAGTRAKRRDDAEVGADEVEATNHRQPELKDQHQGCLLKNARLEDEDVFFQATCIRIATNCPQISAKQ